MLLQWCKGLAIGQHERTLKAALGFHFPRNRCPTEQNACKWRCSRFKMRTTYRYRKVRPNLLGTTNENTCVIRKWYEYWYRWLIEYHFRKHSSNYLKRLHLAWARLGKTNPMSGPLHKRRLGHRAQAMPSLRVVENKVSPSAKSNGRNQRDHNTCK